MLSYFLIGFVITAILFLVILYYEYYKIVNEFDISNTELTLNSRGVWDDLEAIVILLPMSMAMSRVSSDYWQSITSEKSICLTLTPKTSFVLWHTTLISLINTAWDDSSIEDRPKELYIQITEWDETIKGICKLRREKEDNWEEASVKLDKSMEYTLEKGIHYLILNSQQVNNESH